jgi:hypothetical protein
MSGLRDLFAADEDAVFLDEREFAVEVTVTPKGSVNTFVLVLDLAESQENVAVGDLAATEERVAMFLAKRDQCQVGMEAATGTARDLQVNDTFVIAESIAPDVAGEWTVIRSQRSPGGNIEGMARWERLRSAGTTRRDG